MCLCPPILSLTWKPSLFCFEWLLLKTGLIDLSLSLPKLILVHLLQLHFPWLLWVLYLFMLIYHCHWAYVWIAPLIVYLSLIVTSYSCQSKSAIHSAFLFICLPILQNVMTLCFHYIVVWIYCLMVVKRLSIVLHLSYSVCFNYFRNCGPFLPNQFFMIAISSACGMLYNL